MCTTSTIRNGVGVACYRLATILNARHPAPCVLPGSGVLHRLHVHRRRFLLPGAAASQSKVIEQSYITCLPFRRMRCLDFSLVAPSRMVGVFFVVTSCKVNLSRCLVLVSESWLRACSLAELLSGHAPVRDGGRACEQRHGHERAVLRGDVRGELDHSGDLSLLRQGSVCGC